MLKFENFSAKYSNSDIVKNINIDFVCPELSIIIGPNGSGKSTLLKSIEGLTKISSGRILLNDTVLSDININERAKRISYISQHRDIPNITAERLILHGRFPYLSYPRSYSAKDYDIVNETIDKFCLNNYKNINISMLSGGIRQKVYLAMAYAQDTDIILMDEPLTYLDSNSQIEFMNLTKELVLNGKIVIMVLHDIPLALRYSNRIIVMNDGEFIYDGKPDDLVKNPIIHDVFKVDISSIQTEKGIRYFIL